MRHVPSSNGYIALPSSGAQVRVYCPARMLDLAGMQTGSGLTAWLNRTPSLANRSMLGVRATGSP
jgi:hypothetical protein